MLGAGMAEERVVAFEEAVRQSPDRIIDEATDFFMERGTLNEALKNLARQLDEASIPYALVGAIALGRHGLVRMTLDIDVLLTREGLEQFKARFLGRGYVPAFPGAERAFRGADTGVRIKVLTTRDSDPAATAVNQSGIRVLALEKLVELKLASGMTAPHRRRDLSDVQDLIRAVRLPLDFAERLDTSVQAVYRELRQEAQATDPFEQ
jgi:hypothetical protein